MKFQERKDNRKLKRISLSVVAVIIIIAIITGVIIAINKAKENYIVEEISSADINYYKIISDGKSGVIDKDGKVIIEPEYNTIKIPNPKEAIFICIYDYNAAWGEYKTKVLNEKNEEILTNYENVNTIDIKEIVSSIPYEKTVLQYQKNGKYGIIDFNGKDITKPIYEEIRNMPYREGELIVKKEVIEYERLDRIKLETGRKSALFERDEDEITLKGAFARLKTSDELSDTLPLLSYLGITYSKNEVVQDVLDWFDEEIDFLNYGNPMQELRMAVSKSEDVKRLMLQMIQEMDLDIVDFRVEEKENDRIEVFTKHVVDEYEAELNLFDESSGTKKLFGLLPFIAKSLLRGTTLVIDELDAKIHPVLLKYLIMTFSNMEKNKKGAQLIFTSHDLSTMNSEVFRRDEIWFVAKGNRQNSKLYSLVEFKNKKGESVRKDAKFDKQYLEGKYGADPYLRKIIDWGTVNG